MANNNPIQIDLNDTIGSFRQKVNSISSVIGDYEDIIVPTSDSAGDYLDIVHSLNTINSKVSPESVRSQLSLVTTNSNHTTLSYNPVSGVFNFVSRDLTDDDITSIDASKITTGTIDAARIPGIDASKITTGTIDANRLPSAALGAALGDTDALSEGSTNLYFTTSRARASVSAGAGINYDTGTGVISATGITLNQGTGVSISGSTISIGQAVGTSDAVKFSSIVGAVEDVRVSGTAPTTKSNGDTLAAGSMYYDGTGTLYIYTGSAWAAAGGSGGGTSLVAGTGIGISGSSTYTISNTGVTSITAGTNISISQSTGSVTISASSPTPSATDVATAISTFGAGDVGTYVFARVLDTNNYLFGEVISGSSLLVAGIISYSPVVIIPDTTLEDGNATGAITGSTSLSGTWQCMGTAQQVVTTSSYKTTLWLRIA